MRKVDDQQEPTVQFQELYSALRGDPNGKEIQKWGNVCVCVTDSLCCTAETDTALQSNYNKTWENNYP